MSAIPAGYKQTEVGVIPEDWEVKALNDLADKIMVGIASAATHAYRDRGIVMFRNQNIKPGYLDDSDLLYIAEDYEVTFRNKRLKAGDLLTARTGYPGTTSIVPSQYEGAQSFTTLITRPRLGVIDPEYLCIFINSESGQAYFEQNQIGGGQKNVNAGSLKNLPVAFPPTDAEQQAIAEALSDADALIESLEQLVAKKRHLKQGAMQELLTGKKRLPGFSGEWSVKTLGALCRMKSGEAITSESVDEYSEYPCFGGNGLRGFTKSFNHDGNFALVGRQGALCGNVLVATGKFFASEHAVVVTPNRDTDVFWLARVLIRMNLNQYSESSAQPGLSVSKLLVLECHTPPHAEQAAIAAVLSDIDAEIAELETQLAKTRALKQGMMHKLLTGEIRLL